MNKHTFKVGDRVIYTDSPLKTHAGAKGQYWEGTHDGGTRVLSGVKFDNDNLNRLVDNREFFSVSSHASLSHDTDFQVGDWVRYEGVEEGHVTELEGEVGVITSVTGFSTIGVKFPAHWSPDALWNKANLVKIQPPQEEKKMDIRRKADGAIVRDVRDAKNAHNANYKWVKYSPDCRTEYSGEHWEPVEEWVKIEVNKCDEHRLKYAADHRDGEMIRWRYPQ